MNRQADLAVQGIRGDNGHKGALRTGAGGGGHFNHGKRRYGILLLPGEIQGHLSQHAIAVDAHRSNGLGGIQHAAAADAYHAVHFLRPGNGSCIPNRLFGAIHLRLIPCCDGDAGGGQGGTDGFRGAHGGNAWVCHQQRIAAAQFFDDFTGLTGHTPAKQHRRQLEIRIVVHR